MCPVSVTKSTQSAVGLRPDAPFWAVGDVHGRADLLGPLLDTISDDSPTILLGDLINRGPDSAGALRLAREHAGVTALRGNHEDLLLRFLSRPRRTGHTLMRFGGRALLESFGIDDLPDQPRLPNFIVARDKLRAAMGPLERWLMEVPLIWRSGNVAALHAGADPAVPFEQQPDRTFAWGHANFTRHARSDGQWVVHGHAPQPEVNIGEGRIAIDTGAWDTGRLSAVRISDEEVAVVTVTSS